MIKIILITRILQRTDSQLAFSFEHYHKPLAQLRKRNVQPASLKNIQCKRTAIYAVNEPVLLSPRKDCDIFLVGQIQSCPERSGRTFPAGSPIASLGTIAYAELEETILLDALWPEFTMRNLLSTYMGVVYWAQQGKVFQGTLFTSTRLPPKLLSPSSLPTTVDHKNSDETRHVLGTMDSSN